MKSWLSNEYNVLAARIVIGVLFIVMGADKIADPAAFAKSISDYKIISGTPAILLATVLPWVELLAGLGVLFGILLRGSSLLTFFLLAIFMLAILSALLRGLDISCGCFSQDPLVRKVGWIKIAENMILFALCGFLYYSKNTRLSIEQYFRDQAKSQ